MAVPQGGQAEDLERIARCAVGIGVGFTGTSAGAAEVVLLSTDEPPTPMPAAQPP